MDRSIFGKAAAASLAFVSVLELGGCAPAEDQAVSAAAEAARELSQGLPRPVDMANIIAVRAEGKSLIIDLAVHPWNPPAAIEEFRGRAETGDRTRLCGEPATMHLLGMGGVVVSRYSRPGGPAFETRVTTCAAPAPPPVAPRDSLADEIAIAVDAMRITLPTPVDSVTTMTGIRAEGTTVYYEMSINQDVSAAELRATRPGVQADLQRTLCADPDTGRLIRRGATLKHQYTDPSGDRMEAAVSSCPPAVGGGT